MSDRYLRKRELAEKLSVSMSTIERHIKPTAKVGGQNRYLMSDVERQLGIKDNVVELRRIA